MTQKEDTFRELVPMTDCSLLVFVKSPNSTIDPSELGFRDFLCIEPSLTAETVSLESLLTTKFSLEIMKFLKKYESLKELVVYDDKLRQIIRYVF